MATFVPAGASPSQPSVRELVRRIQVEVRDSDLAPARACELLAQLSALMGNTNDEIRQADAAYAAVLLSHLESSEKANRAKIRAECSPEYERKRHARDTKELVVELIRSLKYLIRSFEEEMRLGGGR